MIAMISIAAPEKPRVAESRLATRSKPRLFRGMSGSATRHRSERGYLLVAVAMILTVIAVLGLIGNRESIIGTKRIIGESETLQAGYVAQAGMEHATWVANNSACTGYDLPATPFGTHSYQASFDPTAGSPVTISATATLNIGAASTLVQLDTPVFQPPVLRVMLPVQDSYIGIETPSQNNGLDDDIVTDSQIGLGGVQRSLVQFDLSVIPPGIKLESADLHLYLSANSGSQTDVIEAHRLTRSWTEGDGSLLSGVSWQKYNGINDWPTPGGSFADEIAGSFVAAGTGWKTMKLTDLVQGWINETVDNQGVLLMSTPAAGNNEKVFASRNNSDPALHPQLVLSFACECGVTGTPGSANLQPGAAGQDTYIRDGGNKTNNFGRSDILKINNASAEQASLLRFDLATIPSNAQIQSATLGLWLANGNDLNAGVIDANRVSQTWLEGSEDGDQPAPGAGATYDSYDGLTDWANSGGDYATPPVDSITIPNLTTGWYQWDLTAAVQDWVNGSADNHGVLLRASGGDVDKIEFTSSDGDPSQHPRLVVDYSCPCGIDCI